MSLMIPEGIRSGRGVCVGVCVCVGLCVSVSVGLYVFEDGDEGDRETVGTPVPI